MEFSESNFIDLHMDYSWPVLLRNPRLFYSFHSFQTTDYWGFHLRRRIWKKTAEFSAWQPTEINGFRLSTLQVIL